MDTPSPAQKKEPIGKHAVVIGAGMAGLSAAAVLSGRFERVTIVERDVLPDGPAARPGVPQARHNHLLLARGQRLLSQILPGIEADLAAAGAPRLDWTRDARMLLPSGWVPRFESGLVSFSCSRDLLESVVRRRVAASPGVEFLVGRRAVGLVFDGGNARVTGVTLERNGAPGEGRETLTAELVLDASGRASVAPDWLADAGLPPPRETTVNSYLGYASRWYERPPDGGEPWQALLVNNRPPHLPRGGVLMPIEEGRWAVTLGGMAKDYPPTDEAGFDAFAGSLATRALHDAIRRARPVTPVRGYRKTDNRWRHFERVPRWPDGFFVTGDAVCAFNPAYGQGLTIGAAGAAVLDECLARGLRGAARRFQRALTGVIKVPWDIAIGEDVRWPDTVGARPSPVNRIMYWYIDRVAGADPDDTYLWRTLFEVMHLVKPPTAMLHPRVLRGALLRRRSAPRGDDLAAAMAVHREELHEMKGS